MNEWESTLPHKWTEVRLVHLVHKSVTSEPHSNKRYWALAITVGGGSTGNLPNSWAQRGASLSNFTRLPSRGQIPVDSKDFLMSEVVCKCFTTSLKIEPYLCSIPNPLSISNSLTGRSLHKKRDELLGDVSIISRNHDVISWNNTGLI